MDLYTAVMRKYPNIGARLVVNGDKIERWYDDLGPRPREAEVLREAASLPPARHEVLGDLLTKLRTQDLTPPEINQLLRALHT